MVGRWLESLSSKAKINIKGHICFCAPWGLEGGCQVAGDTPHLGMKEQRTQRTQSSGGWCPPSILVTRGPRMTRHPVQVAEGAFENLVFPPAPLSPTPGNNRTAQTTRCSHEAPSPAEPGAVSPLQ